MKKMPSIATRTGDNGETSLMFGIRVSKDDLRVESYGTIDELQSVLGVARAHCEKQYISERILELQGQLFTVCSELATPPEKLKHLAKRVTSEMVLLLDSHIETIETKHKYTMDWAMPGDHPSSAALDQARTVCRRAERLAIRLYKVSEESHNPILIKYLNRLSDLLWLMARWQEKEHNVNLSSVRDFLGERDISKGL